MHALVPTVLLWLSGLDAFVADAELAPPDRQRREPAGAGRGKRRPVVAADGRRQSELGKGPLHHWADALRVGRGQHLATDEVAAERIGDGERVAEHSDR